MKSEDDTKALLNTGKWAYTIIDKEIYFKYLGNKDKTDLGYILHFDWPESEEQPMKSKYTKLQDSQELITHGAINFPKNSTNNEFIDLYNVLKRNVEALGRVEKLLKEKTNE